MKDGLAPLVKCFLDGGIFLEEAVELLERALIEAALSGAAGNQSKASKLLGIHRNTLKRKIAQYHLERPKRKPVGRKANGRAAKRPAAS